MTAFASIGFAGNPLDRLSELRGDTAALAALERESGARAVVVARNMPACGPGSAFFPLGEATGFGPVLEKILLGRDESGPVYGLLLPDACLIEAEAGGQAHFIDAARPKLAARPDVELRDLRALAQDGVYERETIAVLAQAKAALHWHANHRFCARCGAPTQAAQAGWRRDCPACGAQHFPRLDPVVIVLVTDGERCLLGRQKQFPPGMYSCLAGFVEGGETLEEAARREIFEESGVRIGAVDVLASQPWPFPSSLMVGCRAEALSREIAVDEAELEDCRWFSRDEVRAMIAGEHPKGFRAPKPLAIARSLVDHWLSAGEDET